MAEDKKEEKKIPVFTVLKNNSILKNIFLLHNPSPPTSIENGGTESKNRQVEEEILVVGRHPDCNITLEHPSISRFHIRIHSNPSSLNLSVVDLSSVHGTWVCGKKIEPGVPVHLKEGDSMQLGGSSRVYRLHWVPLSRAYDLDDPFVPPMEAPATVPMEGRVEETHQDDDCMSAENNQIQPLGDELEGLDLLFPNKNLKSCLKKVNPSAPPMPEFMDSSYGDDDYEEVEKKSPSSKDHEGQHFDMENQIPQPSVVLRAPPISEFLYSSYDDGEQEVENKSPSRKDHECQQFDMENQISQPSVVLGAPPMPEFLDSYDDDEEEENKSPSRKDHECQQFDVENQIPQPFVVLGVISARGSLESPQDLNKLESFKHSFSDEDRGKFCSSRKEPEQVEISCLSCETTGIATSSSPSSVIFSMSENQNNFSEENSMKGLTARENSGDTPGKSEQKSILKENMNSSVSAEGFCSVGEIFEEVDSQSSLRKYYEQKRILRAVENGLFDIENSTPQSFASAVSQIEDSESTFIRSEAVESQGSLQKDHEQKKILREAESDEVVKENSPLESFSSAVSQTEDLESPIISSEVQSNLPSIWSRRGKPATVQIQISNSRGKSKRVNVDSEVEALNEDNITNISISKAFFDGDEEETFTPDKKNFTPNTLLLRSMKNKDKVEETTSKSYLKNVNSGSPNSYQDEEMLSSSDKENRTPNVLLQRKPLKRQPKVVTRAPFQSLLVNSTTRSSNYVNFAQSIENTVGGENKRWIMVVDTNCLLNKESRKALQLLKGLKGTQLIIPRIVLRELDSMKRRGSLFRRKTDVSSALLWIEECLLNTKWWIHVQSSSEEGRPIAPTPTDLCPSLQFNEENEGYFPFGSVASPACGGLLEIVSPTAEDHILECALLFRRIKNDGQLVLLSNDVPLKIKAMAQGLICEGVEEFRETLVNPFSERFLWADSSPRGPTWSCADDIVLREKYERYPLKKKPSKLGDGTAKGLKLLLLHSSQYRHISSAR